MACDEPTACVTACGPTTRTMRLKCLTGNAANYFPPLINLDDEDTNLNEPFSEVFSSSVSNELPATTHSLPIDTSTSSANDAADEESQGPNILNLLGLMRKPSHSSFNDAESNEGSGQAAEALSPERCFVGPKSAKRRWAAMGMILDEGSDSEPPVLEPQNSMHRRPTRHCLEEAPSLEAQVELAGEGEESKLPVNEEECLTNTVREACTAETKPTGSNGSEDSVWPVLDSCIVLDS